MVGININGDREHSKGKKNSWAGKTMKSNFMSYKWSFPKQRSSAVAQQQQNPSTKYIMASSVRQILRGDGLQTLDGIRE